jgi:hypothetical protein
MRLLSACLLLGVLIGCSRGGVEITLKTEAPVTDVYVIVGPEKEFLATLAPGAAKSLRMKPVEGQELTVTYKVGERQQSAAGPVLDASTARIDVRLEVAGESRIVFQPVRR